MASPGSEQIWLWIGTIGMALGLLYFLGRGWGVKDKKLKQFYAINIFVTATAFSMYFMMATGRLTWWGISTAALLVLLYVLAQTLSEAASGQSAEARSLTNTLKNALIVLWLAYPVVWLVGTESTLAILPLYAETAAFAFLDVTAKVGFGAYLLQNHDVLKSVGGGSESGSAQPAD